MFPTIAKLMFYLSIFGVSLGSILKGLGAANDDGKAQKMGKFLVLFFGAGCLLSIVARFFT